MKAHKNPEWKQDTVISPSSSSRIKSRRTSKQRLPLYSYTHCWRCKWDTETGEKMLSALTGTPGRLAPIYLPAVPRTHAHCQAAHSFHLALTHLPNPPPSPIPTLPQPLGPIANPRLGCLASLNQVGLCSNNRFINNTDESTFLTCFPLVVTDDVIQSQNVPSIASFF